MLAKTLLAWAVPALLHATAVAQTVRIDFEDLRVDDPRNGIRLERQYEKQGVVFNGVRLRDFAASGLPRFARSGSRAIEPCYGVETCETPIELSFTTPQRRVKVWAGCSVDLRGRAALRLEAFDDANNRLGRSQVAVDAVRAKSIQTPLEVEVKDRRIRRVEVSILEVQLSTLAIDDVEFDADVPMPDLVLAEVQHASEGGRYRLEVRIENPGALASPKTVLKVSSEGHEAQVEVPGIASGQHVGVVVDLNWSLDPGGHSFRLQVDPDGRIQEVREDNNAAEHTIVVPAPKVVVPNVVGRPLREARAMIEGSGLVTGSATGSDESVRSTVRTQTPPAGASVDARSTVFLELEIPARFPWWVALPLGAVLVGGAAYLRKTFQRDPGPPHNISGKGRLVPGRTEVVLAVPRPEFPSITFRIRKGSTVHRVVNDRIEEKTG